MTVAPSALPCSKVTPPLAEVDDATFGEVKADATDLGEKPEDRQKELDDLQKEIDEAATT